MLVHNPELLKGQLQGIMLNAEKCTLKLRELKGRLQAWSEHRITKGKKPTITSVKKNVGQILHAEYMSELIITTVTKLIRKLPLALQQAYKKILHASAMFA